MQRDCAKKLQKYRKQRIENQKETKWQHRKSSSTDVEKTKTANFRLKSLARDFWFLSFFLCGINPVDLYNASCPNRDGQIVFIRQKRQHATQDDVKIRLQPEAVEIVNRYQGRDGRLLSLSDHYSSYETFKSYVSKSLRAVSRRLGFDSLTFYWARYTWATVADSLDISEKIISKALGHKDRSMAGRKYIAFDWGKVDAANRRVIDYCIPRPAVVVSLTA
jgi:integrase